MKKRASNNPPPDSVPGALTESETSPESSLAPGPSFSSMNEVVRHLTGAGYLVSRSKISRDKGKGMIRVNPDGTVLESEVRGYAATLKRVNADVADLNDIHTIKTTREVERLEKQNEKLDFELAREQGKYLPKKDFEAELAARAAMFEAGFRHQFNMCAQEWIVLVNGNTEKTADLLRELNTTLDTQLNSYASTDIYQVMVEDMDDEDI